MIDSESEEEAPTPGIAKPQQKLDSEERPFTPQDSHSLVLFYDDSESEEEAPTPSIVKPQPKLDSEERPFTSQDPPPLVPFYVTSGSKEDLLLIPQVDKETTQVTKKRQAESPLEKSEVFPLAQSTNKLPKTVSQASKHNNLQQGPYEVSLLGEQKALSISQWNNNSPQRQGKGVLPIGLSRSLQRSSIDSKRPGIKLVEIKQAASNATDTGKKKINNNEALLERLKKKNITELNKFLIVATKRGHTKLIDPLLKAGAEISAKDEQGKTALHWACANNQVEIAKILLPQCREVDVNAKDQEGKTALHWACANNHVEVAKILLQRPWVDVNEKDQEGKTALHWACANNQVEVVKFLLQHPKIYINKTAKDQEGKTALHWACANNQVEVVKFLLPYLQFDVNEKDQEGKTALHWACANNHVEVIKILLQQPRIDVNAEDSSLRTPLYIAVWTPGLKLKIVKLLIEHPNVNERIKGPDNKTLLHWAAENGYLEVINILLQKGANATAKTLFHKTTPLHLAVKNNPFGTETQLAIVSALIQHCASTNEQDSRGQTPLHLAVQNKNIELVKLLLQKGNKGDINIKDNDRKTPLHLAASKDQLALFECLLQNGADLKAKDKYGDTPLKLGTKYFPAIPFSKLIAAISNKQEK